MNVNRIEGYLVLFSMFAASVAIWMVFRQQFQDEVRQRVAELMDSLKKEESFSEFIDRVANSEDPFGQDDYFG